MTRTGLAPEKLSIERRRAGRPTAVVGGLLGRRGINSFRPGIITYGRVY
jgi:hypothetical protein